MMSSSPVSADEYPFHETTVDKANLLEDPTNSSTSTTLPTNIHLDLDIPNPHVGFNERTTQWVHDRTWIYSSIFSVSSTPLPIGAKRCLVFEGLDTFATVSLNGTQILESKNMFRSYRVDVTRLVKSGKNVLRMEFASALREGDEIMEENGGERVTWNGHYSRVFVRKAQYHYGWDWGPSLITCGPWKPIRLHTYTSRISKTSVRYFLSPDLTTVTLALTATTETLSAPSTYTLSASIISPSNATIDLLLTPPTSSSTYWTASQVIHSPKLWHPHKHGAPNLYTILFTLSSTQVLDTATTTVGLRRVVLHQDPLPSIPNTPTSGGTTFYFSVNNKPIFMGGSNWIPAHSFLPAVRNGTLRKLLTLLRDRGRQRMLRIWGGGVYESEELYSLCDELGILVWQDICLACGDYPAHLDYFVDEISAEVRENLERLRKHPSLVIVAGNNEDYQVADEELGYDAGQDESEWRGSKFPGRWLYEKVFPEIVREVCNRGEGESVGMAGVDGSGVVYWPGSPWGGEDSTDRTVGDIHQWNVWGGIQAPYQRYPDLGGRFVSEFGMPSYPSLHTIKTGFLDQTLSFEESVARGDWNPEAEIIEHHMKAHSFQKRLFAYIGENFRVMDGTMEERVYLSQLLQSEAMDYAYKGWRRRWTSRECGGALVWQLNDVWPVTSWSIIDFDLRPKPAFYTIARALAPITSIITRKTTNPKPDSRLEALVHSRTTRGAGSASLHSTPHIYPPITSTVTIELSSIHPLLTIPVHVEVSAVDIATNVTWKLGSDDFVMQPNGMVEMARDLEADGMVVYVQIWVQSPEFEKEWGIDFLDVVADWPQPLKHFEFGKRGLVIDWEVENGGGNARITSKRPVKGLIFEEVEGVVWGDNCLDIMPGIFYVVAVKGLQGKRITWRWYGMSKEDIEGAVWEG